MKQEIAFITCCWMMDHLDALLVVHDPSTLSDIPPLARSLGNLQSQATNTLKKAIRKDYDRY